MAYDCFFSLPAADPEPLDGSKKRKKNGREYARDTGKTFEMKIKLTPTNHEFTPETALDRASVEFPELTFESRKEATRILNRNSAILVIKHNSTVIFRGGAQVQGFADDDQMFDRSVDVMVDQLLSRAAPDLAAWRVANPVPKPKDTLSEMITSSPESDQDS